MANASSLKKSLVRILGVVVPIVIAVFLVLHQANFLIGRSLLIAFGDHESTYRSAWFELDGDIVARDLVIDPYDLGPEAGIRFEHIHIETPGWFWFLRNTFDRKLKRARLDRIHLTLTGGVSLAGLEPSLGDLGPFGASSASPFEAEGCMEDSIWLRDELTGMGLTPGPTRLEFDYRVVGSKVETTITLDTPGVSQVTLERRETLDRPVNALVLDYAPTITDSEQWTIVDAGFVKARNKLCAERDGIDEAEFVRRHVASVHRLLQTAGLAVDAATLDAYRAFASGGGRLTFGGTYVEPLHSDEFYEVRDSGEALLRMQGVIERNGQRRLVQWQQFDPIPLAGLEDGLPTYAALLRERDDDGDATTTAAVAAPVTDTQPAATAEPPADAAATVAPAAAAPATAAATTPAAAATTTPAAVAPTPTAAANGGASGSTASPRIAAAPTPPPRPTNIALDWSQLDDYPDEPIRIWTVHGPPRTVLVLEATPQYLRVRSRMGGGYADFTIQRESFKRAMVVR